MLILVEHKPTLGYVLHGPCFNPSPMSKFTPNELTQMTQYYVSSSQYLYLYQHGHLYKNIDSLSTYLKK